MHRQNLPIVLCREAIEKMAKRRHESRQRFRAKRHSLSAFCIPYTFVYVMNYVTFGNQHYDATEKNHNDTCNDTLNACEWARNRFEIYESADILLSKILGILNPHVADTNRKWNETISLDSIYLMIAYIRYKRSIALMYKRRGDRKWRLSRVHHIVQCMRYGARCKNNIPHTMLLHWGRDKMAAISQTMFSNTFSWMKMYEFRLRFR